MFDVTSKRSFEELEYWVRELQEKTDKEVRMFLVGNKEDKAKDEQVSAKTASAYAKKIRA